MGGPIGKRVSLTLMGESGRTPNGTLARTISLWGRRIYQIELDDEDVVPEAGSRVALHFEDTNVSHVEGKVVRVDGRRISVWRLRMLLRDQREFPRVDVDVLIEYCAAPEAVEPQVLDVWIDGGSVPEGVASWRCPRSIVNLSVSGLRFHDEHVYVQGDLLLVTVGLPSRSKPWRAVARVVRVESDPVVGAEGTRRAWSATRHIAVSLVQFEEGAQQALMDYTVDHLFWSDA